MHHLTCGISFLHHSVNLILFTLFLVHLHVFTSSYSYMHHLITVPVFALTIYPCLSLSLQT